MPLPVTKLIKKACMLGRRKDPEQLLYCLDRPGPREIRPGRINAFSGWAYAVGDQRVAGIEVCQDGTLLGTCEYGLEREDVYKAYPRCPQARISGFFAWIPIPEQAAGPVYMYIVDAHGRRREIARLHPSRSSGSRKFFNTTLARRSAGKTSRKKPVAALDIPRQILIAGMAKTGTTGLFFKIGNSLISCGGPALQTKLLFEPTSYSGPGDQRVLAKIIVSKKDDITIWGDGRKIRWADYNGFKNFDRKILLHRDPRDRLISSLLYSAQNNVFKKNTACLDAFLALLKKKEQNPGTVTLLELLELRLRTGTYSLQTWKNGLKETIDYFLDFRRKHRDFFHYRYEDFVQGTTAGLEKFLGFPLCGDASVGSGLERVVRTKKSGDWHNWFTEEDISFFRPVFQEMLREFGYGDAWELPERKIILPAHASEYVQKITRP